MTRPDVDAALARFRACASSVEITDHVTTVHTHIRALEEALRETAELARDGQRDGTDFNGCRGCNALESEDCASDCQWSAALRKAAELLGGP